MVGLRGSDVPDGLWPEPTRMGSLRANFATEFDERNLVVRPDDNVTEPFTTLWEAIGNLPALVNGEKGDAVKPYATEPTCDYQRRLRDGSDGVTCHEAPRLSAINMRRLSHIGPGQNWTAIPTELLPRGMRIARRRRSATPRSAMRCHRCLWRWSGAGSGMRSMRCDGWDGA